MKNWSREIKRGRGEGVWKVIVLILGGEWVENPRAPEPKNEENTLERAIAFFGKMKSFREKLKCSQWEK